MLSSGLEATIQDLPGRQTGLGVPRSGPMDFLSFRAANILVGNHRDVEGIEVVTVPGVGCKLQFHVPAVVAVTGKDVVVKIDSVVVEMWARLLVPSGGKLEVGGQKGGKNSTGFRNYVAVQGGFPEVPLYLGSKSTSMGLGGYQVIAFLLLIVRSH